MSTDELLGNAPAQVGQIVADRYEITAHLGTGGFAKVYRGFDRSIEREVAVKFLDLRSMNAGGALMSTVLERFQREAKLAARIPHRNVVQIYDIGQVDDDPYRPFIVMELLIGHDLDEHMMREGPLAPQRALPLFVDCLDALGEAHKQEIVHKDLKPSNLFLSSPGTRSEALRIVDFGIAHIKGSGAKEAGKERLTATGQILGTLQYLAPEYIAHQTVSPALDVYQMGLILVETLSGKRLIESDNPFECLRIHTFGLLEIPQYLLESPLGPIIERALHPDPLLRYPDAEAFADALSKVGPSTVPASPLLQGGGELRMSRFQDASSSPGMQAPMTGELRAPSTGEYRTEPGMVPGGFAHADTAPQDLSQAPTLEHAPEAASPAQRAQHNRQETIQHDMPASAPHGVKLKAAAAAVVVAILACVGVIAALASASGGKPAETAQTTASVTTNTTAPEPPATTASPAPAAPTPQQIAAHAQAHAHARAATLVAAQAQAHAAEAARKGAASRRRSGRGRKGAAPKITAGASDSPTTTDILNNLKRDGGDLTRTVKKQTDQAVEKIGKTLPKWGTVD